MNLVESIRKNEMRAVIGDRLRIIDKIIVIARVNIKERRVKREKRFGNGFTPKEVKKLEREEKIITKKREKFIKRVLCRKRNIIQNNSTKTTSIDLIQLVRDRTFISDRN